MANVQAVTEFRRRRKENLIRLMGNGCALCGYNYCVGALEFHHINPEEKSYGLASGICHKIEDDVAEAKKCLLLCANCHREVHDSDKYDGVDLFQYQKIDQTVEEELLDSKKQRMNEPKCSDCGKPITIQSKSGKCPSCVQKGKKRVAIHPSREELKNLIRTVPFTQIADMYCCSDNAIRKWCDKENLPRNKKTIDRITDEDWEKI